MCDHKNIMTTAQVTRLTNPAGDKVTGWTADVRIECTDCRTPFMFRGLPPGSSMAVPTVSIDATEARMPICPQGEAFSPLDDITAAMMSKQ